LSCRSISSLRPSGGVDQTADPQLDGGGVRSGVFVEGFYSLALSDEGVSGGIKLKPEGGVL